MIRRNMLTLGCLVLALAASALLGQSVNAGQPSKNSNNHNQNHGHKSGGSFQHHNHNQHSQHSHHNHHNHNNHKPFGGPLVKVPVKQVLYCVMVRQPDRYHDGNWHQVKCFYSSHEAEFFAASLRSKFHGENGFGVRIDRRW